MASLFARVGASKPPSMPALPTFNLDPSAVHLLYHPEEFHKCLLEGYRHARRRIVLASLYIGTAKKEALVIDAIYQACLDSLGRGENQATDPIHCTGPEAESHSHISEGYCIKGTRNLPETFPRNSDLLASDFSASRLKGSNDSAPSCPHVRSRNSTTASSDGGSALSGIAMKATESALPRSEYLPGTNNGAPLSSTSSCTPQWRSERVSEGDSKAATLTVDILMDRVRGTRLETTKDGRRVSSLSTVAPLLRLKSLLENPLAPNGERVFGRSAEALQAPLVGTRQQSPPDASPHIKIKSPVTETERSQPWRTSQRRVEGGDSMLTTPSKGRLKDRVQSPSLADSSSPSPFRCTPNSESPAVKINVSMFQSPTLANLLYKLLPARVNEVMGVFHTKVFIFDNTVVLTGANISESYLSDRQDRYVVVTDESLASALQSYIKTLQSVSYDLSVPSPTRRNTNDNSMISPRCSEGLLDSERHAFAPVASLPMGVPNPSRAPRQFKRLLGSRLMEFLSSFTPPPSLSPHRLPSQTVQQASLPVGRQLTTIQMAIQSGYSYPSIHHERDALLALIGRHCSGSHREIEGNEYDNTDAADSFNEHEESKLLRSEGRPRGKRNCRQMEQSSQGDESEIFSTPISKIVMASGYLNLPKDLLDALGQYCEGIHKKCIETCDRMTDVPESLQDSPVEIFCAAPEANSFHESRGLSCFIPMAYSYLCGSQMKFIKKAWERGGRMSGGCLLESSLNYIRGRRSRNQGAITEPGAHPGRYSGCGRGEGPRLWEFTRENWTFHSKGIWLYPADSKADGKKRGDSRSKVPRLDRPTDRRSDPLTRGSAEMKPFASVVGSSNYGLRSRVRDLDLSFLICTDNERLQAEFQSEVEGLRRHSRNVTCETGSLIGRCPWWLRIMLSWTGLKSLL